MSKASVIEELKQLIKNGEIERKEVEVLFESPDFHKKDIRYNLFYYIGGLVLLVGIGLLITQNWELIGTWGRVLSTLGVFVVLYFAASVADKREVGEISFPFYIVAYVMLPIGIGVTMSEFYSGVIGIELTLLFSIMCFAIAYLTYLLRRDPVHMFFSFVFGTYAYFVLIDYIYYLTSADDYYRRTAYVFFVVSLIYLFYARLLLRNAAMWLVGNLVEYAGLITLIVSAVVLTGSREAASFIWLSLTPLIFLFLAYLSSYFSSKKYLWLSFLGIAAYLIKITFDYFEGSQYWPLGVILCGAMIIFAGFVVFRLRDTAAKKIAEAK